MRYTNIGTGGLALSRIGFGCGDNARLMVGDDRRLQEATVGRALAAGVTYFDTAAKYGDGRSEENLGRVLRSLGSAADGVVVGSKLLLDPRPERISRGSLRALLEASLRRLGRDRLDLYQLHDRIVTSPGRGWAPAGSRHLTPTEVLAPGGIAETLRELQQDGLVGELGLTTYGGEPSAIAEVLASGVFASINSSVHMLNPTALQGASHGWPVLDYEGIAAWAAERGLAVLAIRALGGGRLVSGDGRAEGPPRPADADVRWDPSVAELVRHALSERGTSAVSAALGWVLAWPQVTTVICGFSAAHHVDEACATEAGPPCWTEQEARGWAAQLVSGPGAGPPP